MRRALVLAVCALALGLAREARAVPTAGFERPGGGPRAAALGGHSIVLPDDDFALGTNPGRLVFAARSASAQFDRVDPAVELWRGRIGLALPIGPDVSEPFQTSPAHQATLGFALDVTSLTLIEGSAYREAALAIGGAIAPISILGLGAAVRFERANSDAQDLAGHAFGVDFGGSIELADHVAAGLAIRNAFGRARFDGGDDEDRAAELTIGVAATHHRRWQAEADYVYARNTTSALSGGAELHVVPGTFDLRGGVAREMAGTGRVVPSAGAGFILKQFRIDYAFRSDTDGGLDAQHQLALGARF